MSVSAVLTPAAIAEAEYSTAKTPVLGAEKDVYLTTSASRLLGTAFLTADGVIQYTYVGLPTAGTPGPIVVAATGAGILQLAADTITYGGLTGSFTPVAWSSNQTFDFPVGRAVELTGTYSAPTSSSVPSLTLSPGAGMLRGSKFQIWELPPLTSFHLAGCTTEKSVKLPVRGTKSIPCGMEGAEWTTPGMSRVGELSATGLNQGFDDGLLRYAGTKCQAMLVTTREQRLIVQRDFCMDWTPEVDNNYPSGDGESTVALRGEFSKIAILLAPGGG